MEQYVIIFFIILFFAIMIFSQILNNKKRKKALMETLKNIRGKHPEKRVDSERWNHIGAYFKRSASGEHVDDITWNDLDMDDIYKRLDYTLSSSGEEYLYRLLRESFNKNIVDPDRLEKMVARFKDDDDLRIRLSVILNDLGHSGKFSLWEYMDNLDYLGERSNVSEYLLNLCFIILIALIPINPAVFTVLTVLFILYRIITYFRFKGEIEPYLISVRFLSELVSSSDQMSNFDELKDFADEELYKSLKTFSRIKKSASFLAKSVSNYSTSDFSEMFMDYIKMMTHVDIIIFNNLLKKINGNLEKIEKIYDFAGFLDAAISVYLFRESIETYCIPKRGDFIKASQIYHPLLTDPVKNDITAEKSVLLTGSNASGKSTFLKAVAVNVILAGAINTATAEEFFTPDFRIYSSMALRDSIQDGKSFFVVEIGSLKRIYEGSLASKRPVICFVDEVLRGTNTVERIAASTSVLQEFAENGIICFAATHDIELTSTLSGLFDNYHFEEFVEDGEVKFPYKLLEGPSVSRNALQLIGQFGFPENAVKKARKMVEQFNDKGIWNS